MLNIAICDDDIQTTGRMDMLLQKIAKRNFMEVTIDTTGKSLADSVDYVMAQLEDLLN